MKNIYSLLFLLCIFLQTNLYSQAFNKVMALSPSHRNVGSLIYGDHIFTVVNTDFLGTRPWIIKSDKQGNEISKTMINFPVEVVNAEGIFMESDSTFLVYGRWVIGCDYVNSRGLGVFVARMDTANNILNKVYFVDEVGFKSAAVSANGVTMLCDGAGSYILNSSLDSASATRSYLHFERGFVLDSNRFLLENAFTSYTLTIGDTNFAHTYLGPQEKVYPRDNSTVYSYKTGSGKLYINDNTSFNRIDSIDFSSHLSFNDSVLFVSGDAIVIPEVKGYKYVLLNLDGTFLDSSQTLTKAGINPGEHEIRFKDSLIVIARDYRNTQTHFEVRKLSEQHAPPLDSIVFKTIHNQTILDTQQIFNDSVILVEATTSWKIRVINYGNIPLHQVQFNYHNDAPGICFSNFYSMLKDGILIHKNDSLDIMLPDLKFTNILYPGFDTRIWVYPVSANGLILNEAGTLFKNGNLGITINEFIINLNLKIYPNPASEILHIEGNYQSLKIVDVTGKLWYQSNNYQENLDISQLPNGIYLLSIETQQGFSNLRFVKN